MGPRLEIENFLKIWKSHCYNRQWQIVMKLFNKFSNKCSFYNRHLQIVKKCFSSKVASRFDWQIVNAYCSKILISIHVLECLLKKLLKHAKCLLYQYFCFQLSINFEFQSRSHPQKTLRKNWNGGLDWNSKNGFGPKHIDFFRFSRNFQIPVQAAIPIFFATFFWNGT